jgi:hypothetical protein
MITGYTGIGGSAGIEGSLSIRNSSEIIPDLVEIVQNDTNEDSTKKIFPTITASQEVSNTECLNSNIGEENIAGGARIMNTGSGIINASHYMSPTCIEYRFSIRVRKYSDSGYRTYFKFFYYSLLVGSKLIDYRVSSSNWIYLSNRNKNSKNK